MKTYSLVEAAKILQTSETTLGTLLNTAVIPAAKIGQLWVIREDNLDAYLKAEVERQTLERIEFIKRGEKPRVATGSRRTVKPDLDKIAA
jgi:excisionase family DNA binding protein